MITWHDVVVVVAATLAVAVGGTAAGAMALRVLRSRSLRVSVGVVALTVVTVMAGAVALVGALMLVSGHALVVLVASVTAAALAGLGVAALLGREVERGSRSLRDLVRRLAAGQEGPGAARAPAAAELAGLGRELELAQRSLADARRRGTALEASRRELVAWVSHDLRTPLADVRAMAEALEDGVVADTETVRAYHRGIRVESERLARMVEDLFELSRIQAGSLGLAPDLLDLADVVASETRPAGELARRREVRLRVEHAGAVPVIADAAHLGRAVRNLVANAVRHTEPGSEVVVTVGRRAGGGVEVSVLDGCGGIPEADLARVFDVGFRGQGARTPGPDHGAGLGLAIARGIVEAHDGSLDVGNEPPGCRFTMLLPGDGTTPRPRRKGGTEAPAAVRAGRDSGSRPPRSG